jgi:dTDP-4-amino-4,6-dideoxygalactose transaminase
MAMMCLDLEPGDEVIVPAINFRSAAMAVVGQGGQVVWCEVDPRTLNADPADVEKRITSRTRAIFPVHMNGLSAPMDDLLEIAERHPRPRYGPPKVIGDAARACGGGYRGTKIGKKGWMTVFSFHTQKLMTTLGEGGAITTDDAEVAHRLRGLRQFGVGTDGWGTNYKMTKVQAAVGLVQLRRLDDMIARRVKVARQRTELLQGIPALTLPTEPPGYEHTFYLYTLLVPREWAGEKRDRVISILEEYGVGCCVANRPVYADIAFLRERTAGQELPLSDELGGRLFCVALHPMMTEAENEYIAAALWEAVERVRSIHGDTTRSGP